MSDYSTRNIIDYAFDGDGIKFREELYGSIHDRVSAHIDAKKKEVAQGLLGQNEEVEGLGEDSLDNFSLEEIEEFMQTEDYERLDETGKAKLVMYMTKAGADRSLTGYKKGMDTGRAIGKGMDYSATSKSMDKLDAKRSKGMNTAAIKLANKTDDPTKYASGKYIKSEGVSIYEANEPSPIAGTVKKHTYVQDAHKVEVRYNPEFSEYSAHPYKNGKHMGEGPVSYHGNDKEDAHNTAKSMLVRLCK